MTGTDFDTLTIRAVHDWAQGRLDTFVRTYNKLEERITTLDNKVARLEHHFVTLDKQLGKQARRIEELEAAQARQGNSE